MKYILLLCIITIYASCQSNTKQYLSPDTKQTRDSIIIPGNPDLTLKIRTLKIHQEPYLRKIQTSGIVKAIPNNYAEIASPFSGRIIRSFVCLGQKVNVGSPVFEISSPTFFEAGKAYYQSKQEMQLADKNLKRQQDLLNNGVGTQKDLEEAEVNFELTKRDFENSIASLKVYHVDPEELVLGQPLIIRSPIKGEIAENKIVIGQYLKEDAEPVAIVTELSKVWVVGQLKEKDLTSVHKSDEVEIRLTGMPDIPVKGLVFHVGEILDEATRSVQIYVLCENSDRIMKPGMFVSTQFSENTGSVILVPSGSLYQMEETSFVFVYLGDDKYVKRHVEVNGTDGNRVIIKNGLKPGDEIVIEGGSLLLDLNTKL
jgi:membrane fusion protein, heavy metal efflux system